MRLFTCLPIDEEIRDRIAAVQGRLAAAGANVRWVAPENFHLTVTFVGDVADESLLPEIAAACENIAAASAPFRFGVRGVSVFPKHKPQIKTVLMAVPGGAEEWKALVRRADPWLTPFGATRENSLMPHITLGRVKGEQGVDGLRAAILAEQDTDCGEQVADRLVLMESVLDPQGATYNERGAWRLTNAG